MVQVNGFIMDMRTAPPEFQKAAFENGLIPFIPSGKKEPPQKHERKILESSSPTNKCPSSSSTQKQKNEGSTLFDGLEK